ncbi:MAG TPA: hypothetical protein VFE12_11530, partial [Acetobacteraceae bacterium]|nr:hypothetical protein [Acetobacteraceae bacterium]
LLAAVPAVAQRAGTSTFSVVNRTTTMVRELFATPSGNGNWGQNRLDGRNGNPSSLAPGARVLVRRRGEDECRFDLRVVFQGGRSEERKGVNVCSVEEVAIGTASAATANDAKTGKAADDPSFRLFNRSPVPVTEVYATPAGTGNWGQNRVSGGGVPPDKTQQFALPHDGSCIYDLRVVFGDKRSLERKRTNLCKVAELPVP